jgi:hypothetical protein
MTMSYTVKEILTRISLLRCQDIVITMSYMKKKPPSIDVGKGRTKLLQVRVEPLEKQAFTEAAALDGKDLSGWVRDRLRRLSREELHAHGHKAAFLSTGEP